MTQEDAVDLAYKMNAALGAYLESMALTFEDRAKAKAELVQLFWDEKAGIISYLLGGPASKDRL